jgi:hypothetical protein
MSDRMLSTSNQYGPCVCSGDVVQVRTASNSATMSSAGVEGGASGPDDVAERAALGAPLVALVPAHAARRDHNPMVPPSDSARRLLTSNLLRRTSSFSPPCSTSPPSFVRAIVARHLLGYMSRRREW